MWGGLPLVSLSAFPARRAASLGAVMGLLGYIVLLVLAGLSTVSAFASSCCSIEDRTELIDGWAKTWGVPDAGHRVTIAKAVFLELFKKDPKSKALFNKVGVDDVNSGAFQAHCVRVLNGLDVAINLLRDPMALDLHLHHLSLQHRARPNVTAHHFQEMKSILEKILGQVSVGFNAKAFKNCFERIAEGITVGLPA